MPEDLGKSRALRIGSLLCALPALYLLGVAFYALMNFDAFGSTPPYFLRYILVPAALSASLFWLAFKASHSTAALVGGNLCAVFLAFFAYEGLTSLRIVRSIQESMSAAASMDDGRESLPMGSTVRRLNDALRVDELSEAFLGGLPHKTVLKCIHPERGPVTYEADRFGFNNPDSIYDDGRIEALFLGDSFMEGICLKPGQGVAGLVRRKGHTVASLGMRGNGPLLELAALGRFGPVMKPRHTFVVYYSGNDWDNLEDEAATPWLHEALAADARFGSPNLSQEQLAKAEMAMEELRKTSGDAKSTTYRLRMLRNFLALAQTWSTIGLHYPELPKPQPMIKAVIRRMRDLTRSWGGDLTIVFVPPAERFRGVLPNDFAFDAQRKILTEVAKSTGVRLIDLAGRLDEVENPASFYAPDGHFSQRGAGFVANIVSEELSSGKLAQAYAR